MLARRLNGFESYYNEIAEPFAVVGLSIVATATGLRQGQGRPR